jgi:hypothetical protein
MDFAHFVTKTSLEKRYESPLLPYILYNDTVLYRGLSSLVQNRQLTNNLQPTEVISCIRGLLKQFADPIVKKRIGLLCNWGFVFEFNGKPELVCENEQKVNDQTVICIRLEDILYPPLEPRETMLLTAVGFVCIVGLCKFLNAV